MDVVDPLHLTAELQMNWLRCCECGGSTIF